MTISEVVKEAQVNLNKFNLEVAEFRVKYGMSPDLRMLYERMGELDSNLIELQVTVRRIEELDKTICSTFISIKRRNGEYA